MDKDYFTTQNLVYLDIETDDSEDCGTDPYRSKIVTLQMMMNGVKGIRCNNEITTKRFKFLEKAVVVGHNLLFECKFIKHHLNITLKNVYDTMIAEHVITGGVSGRTSLNDLTEKYCGITLDKTLQRSFVYGKEPSPAQIEYAYQDIVHLETIMKKQLAEVARLNLWNTLEIEMNCVPAVAWMELSGANVDIPTLKEIEATVRAQKDSVEETLKSELTYEQSDAKGKQDSEEVKQCNAQKEAQKNPEISTTVGKNLKEVVCLLKNIPRKGMIELLYYMLNNEFFTTPASTRYHGNYQGGLCEHSLNVYKLFSERNGKLDKALPEESVIICGLLHDLCKLGHYKTENGKISTVANSPAKKAHATLSLQRIKQFITLTDREEAIILYHMGVYGAFTTYPGEICEYKPIELRKAIQKDVLVQVFASCDNEESHTAKKPEEDSLFGFKVKPTQKTKFDF